MVFADSLRMGRIVNFLTSLVFIFGYLDLFAQQGGIHGGGGDPRAINFLNYGKQIAAWLLTNPHPGVEINEQLLLLHIDQIEYSLDTLDPLLKFQPVSSLSCVGVHKLGCTYLNESSPEKSSTDIAGIYWESQSTTLDKCVLAGIELSRTQKIIKLYDKIYQICKVLDSENKITFQETQKTQNTIFQFEEIDVDLKSFNPFEEKSYKEIILPMTRQWETYLPNFAMILSQHGFKKKWRFTQYPLKESEHCVDANLSKINAKFVACQNDFEVRIYEPWFRTASVKSQAMIITYENWVSFQLETNETYKSQIISDEHSNELNRLFYIYKQEDFFQLRRDLSMLNLVGKIDSFSLATPGEEAELKQTQKLIISQLCAYSTPALHEKLKTLINKKINEFTFSREHSQSGLLAFFIKLDQAREKFWSPSAIVREKRSRLACLIADPKNDGLYSWNWLRDSESALETDICYAIAQPEQKDFGFFCENEKELAKFKSRWE